MSFIADEASVRGERVRGGRGAPKWRMKRGDEQFCDPLSIARIFAVFCYYRMNPMYAMLGSTPEYGHVTYCVLAIHPGCSAHLSCLMSRSRIFGQTK
jgi:hypothetical protein